MDQPEHPLWRLPLALGAVLLLGACAKPPATAQPAAPRVSVAAVLEQPVND